MEREVVVRYLNDTRSALLRTIEAFPKRLFAVPPAEGCWSAAQTLEHVVLVEGRALGRIQLALKEPPDPFRKGSMAGRDEELLKGVRIRSQRVQAPALIPNPSGKQSREELLTAFEAARETTTIFALETKADLRLHFAKHPLFGDLDCYQWLMLIPSHGERHRAQIEECQASLSVSHGIDEIVDANADAHG